MAHRAAAQEEEDDGVRALGEVDAVADAVQSDGLEPAHHVTLGQRGRPARRRAGGGLGERGQGEGDDEQSRGRGAERVDHGFT